MDDRTKSKIYEVLFGEHRQNMMELFNWEHLHFLNPDVDEYRSKCMEARKKSLTGLCTKILSQSIDENIICLRLDKILENYYNCSCCNQEMERFSGEAKQQILNCIKQVVGEKRKQGNLSKEDLPVNLFKKLAKL